MCPEFSFEKEPNIYLTETDRGNTAKEKKLLSGSTDIMGSILGTQTCLFGSLTKITRPS